MSGVISAASVALFGLSVSILVAVVVTRSRRREQERERETKALCALARMVARSHFAMGTMCPEEARDAYDAGLITKDMLRKVEGDDIQAN